MSSQVEFLARVRRALRQSTGLADGPASPTRNASVPTLQEDTLRRRLPTDRSALISQLQDQLTAVGGVVARVTTAVEVNAYISRLAQAKHARRVVRWPSELFTALEVDATLQELGIAVQVATPPADDSKTVCAASALDTARQAMREALAEADIGLSTADVAIAETGTLALSAQPEQMRGVSLLPPVHVAVIKAEHIVADMAAYLSRLQQSGSDLQACLTSCVSFITGPSRTGDIELVLTVGVHGPGELHLVILDEPAAC